MILENLKYDCYKILVCEWAFDAINWGILSLATDQEKSEISINFLLNLNFNQIQRKAADIFEFPELLTDA